MKTLFAVLIISISGFATTVSSITCSGQTATVNATAHGLIASQGFSLSGTSPTFNSTTGTVTANSFTFTLPAGTACSGFTTGYTAVAPAKQIINVSSFVNSQGNITINYISWYTVTNAVPLACNLPVTSGNPPVTTNTGCPVSQWAGASAAENAAILAGTTIEVPGSTTFAASTSSTMLSGNLVALYNAAQASYTSGFLGYAGYWWNGTAWANH